MTAEQALRALGAAWDRLDVDALVELFAEDGVVEDPLLPRTARGHAEIRELYGPSMADLSDCTVTVGHLLEGGDVGMAEGRFESVLAADGARMDFDFAMVVELREGRIARLAEYFDTRPLLPT